MRQSSGAQSCKQGRDASGAADPSTSRATTPGRGQVETHADHRARGESLAERHAPLATVDAAEMTPYLWALLGMLSRRPSSTGTIEDKVDGFVNDLDTTLVNGSGAASKCTSKELTAAGKKAAAQLTCQAKVVGKNKTVGLSSCLAAAASRFSTAYGKAMTPGHCITSTDAMTVEGKVDMFVNDVTSTLAP